MISGGLMQVTVREERISFIVTMYLVTSLYKERGKAISVIGRGDP
jgi:hypothetical protein